MTTEEEVKRWRRNLQEEIQKSEMVVYIFVLDNGFSLFVSVDNKVVNISFDAVNYMKNLKIGSIAKINRNNRLITIRGAYEGYGNKAESFVRKLSGELFGDRDTIRKYRL